MSDVRSSCRALHTCMGRSCRGRGMREAMAGQGWVGVRGVGDATPRCCKDLCTTAATVTSSWGDAERRQGHRAVPVPVVRGWRERGRRRVSWCHGVGLRAPVHAVLASLRIRAIRLWCTVDFCKADGCKHEQRDVGNVGNVPSRHSTLHASRYSFGVGTTPAGTTHRPQLASQLYSPVHSSIACRRPGPAGLCHAGTMPMITASRCHSCSERAAVGRCGTRL